MLPWEPKLILTDCWRCNSAGPGGFWALLPEVVARVQGLIGGLVIKATEGVFWAAAMEPTVQVAVPVDLNAHDPSLGKTRRQSLSPAARGMQPPDLSLHRDGH